MNAESQSFDPIWEEKYSSGHQQRAPWDEVVSYVFRNMPKDKPRSEIKILEVGCGTASNLWFFALEGFDVYGIEGSAAAIETAKNRFQEDDITGDLRVGDFTSLPFEDETFDLVIDRGALTCCGTQDMRIAIKEIHRCIKPNGKFLYTPICDNDTSASSGEESHDGVRINISEGSFQGVGQIRFVSKDEIEMFVPKEDWNILSIHKEESTDHLTPAKIVTAHWRVIAQKI